LACAHPSGSRADVATQLNTMFSACCAHLEETPEVVGPVAAAEVKLTSEIIDNKVLEIVEPVPEWSAATAFDCNLLASKGYGLTVDVWPTHLQVLSIDGGSAKAYNASSPQDTQIMPNDFIVMVNGATDPKEMKETLLRDAAVAMKVFHPASLTVKVEKGGNTLGLKLAIHAKSGSCLWIDQIEDGAVQQYNAGKAAESQLALGDLIASVNGVVGVATKMVDEIHSSEVVELVVLRLSSPSSQ